MGERMIRKCVLSETLSGEYYGVVARMKKKLKHWEVDVVLVGGHPAVKRTTAFTRNDAVMVARLQYGSSLKRITKVRESSPVQRK